MRYLEDATMTRLWMLFPRPFLNKASLWGPSTSGLYRIPREPGRQILTFYGFKRRGRFEGPNIIPVEARAKRLFVLCGVYGLLHASTLPSTHSYRPVRLHSFRSRTPQLEPCSFAGPPFSAAQRSSVCDSDYQKLRTTCACHCHSARESQSIKYSAPSTSSWILIRFSNNNVFTANTKLCYCAIPEPC